MMFAAVGCAYHCLQQQARARGTTVMPSPRVADEGPVRVEDAREAYRRSGSVDIEPPGKPGARPADRDAPEIC